jgi:multiple sugar transport system substrate-binding protein
MIWDLDSKDAIINAAKEGKIVSFVADPSYITSLMKSAPEYKGKWGIMKLPAFEPGGNRDVSFGGSSLMINKNSPNTSLAKEFIKFAITDERTQMDALNKYGQFPADTDIYNLVAFNKPIDYFNSKVWYLFAKVENGQIAVNYTNYFPNIREVEESNLSQDTLDGNDIPFLLNVLQRVGESKIAPQ